jgi:hypothetical protein
VGSLDRSSPGSQARAIGPCEINRNRSVFPLQLAHLYVRLVPGVNDLTVEESNVKRILL